MKRLKETIYSYIETFENENLNSVDIATVILAFKEFQEFNVEHVMKCLHELTDEGKISRNPSGWCRYVYKITSDIKKL